MNRLFIILILSCFFLSTHGMSQEKCNVFQQDLNMHNLTTQQPTTEINLKPKLTGKLEYSVLLTDEYIDKNNSIKNMLDKIYNKEIIIITLMSFPIIYYAIKKTMDLTRTNS